MNNSVALLRRELIPVVSQFLWSWIEDGPGGRVYGAVGDPDNAPMRFPRCDPSWEMLVEAERVLPEFETWGAGPSSERVEKWLRVFAVSMPNAPDNGLMDGVCRSYATLLSDIPASVFSAETARRAGQTFRFWPSVAEIVALVEPEATPIRCALADVRRLAKMAQDRREAASRPLVPAPWEMTNEEFFAQRAAAEKARLDAVRERIRARSVGAAQEEMS